MTILATTFNQTAGADAEVQPVLAVPRNLPVAASAAVADFFDLDEEAFEAATHCVGANEGEIDLRAETTSSVPHGGHRAASVEADPGTGAGAGPCLVPPGASRPLVNQTRELIHGADPVARISPRADGRSSARGNNFANSGPHAAGISNNESEQREAEATAALCRQFDELMAGGFHSLRSAAAELGKSASYFSGDTSVYARWKRGGLAALAPARRVAAPGSRAMDLPAWFIPAARFFYIFSNYRRAGGSVPEAVRRTISLPVMPTGWNNSHKARFLKAIGGLTAVPACPVELREDILARQNAGRAIVPETVAKAIAVPASVVQMHRSPRAWALDNQTAPGSQRRYFSMAAGQRQIMQPGDWFGGDDATPGIAVCVPCSEVITPCSERYGVLLGRFQWLAYHDARTDKILAWDYVVRPRGSYRAEDILNGMGTVVRTHGVPRQGWQFEGGTFNSKLVRQAIDLLKCEHWRTYSPHQKAIESIFNRVWTRLAVQFPHADMGRYRGENEANCHIYEACKAGHKDPRHYFPTIDLVVRVFEEEVAAHNAKRIFSEQYGQWVPDDYFARTVATAPLRCFSEDMGWIFSPYAVERKIQKMLVKCRVPMFEDFSVPFEFNAPWMPLHTGKLVRLHFNPREPRCTAKVILLKAAGDISGEILGDAQLIGETTGYIRLAMGWADDNQRAGYVARQRTANYVRRVSRGIGAGGRATYSADEQRDGLGTVTRIERSAPAPASVAVCNSGSEDPVLAGGHRVDRPAPEVHNSRAVRLESSPTAPISNVAETAEQRRARFAARRHQVADAEAATAHLRY